MSGSRRLVVCWCRIIGVLLCLGLLQACSAIKLGYNNAPELVYWWLDSYADLTDLQSLKARDDLARLQQWHRTTELPKIAELLQTAQQIAPGNTSGDQVCGLLVDVRARIEAAVAQAEPAAFTLAVGLSAAQLGRIEAKFAKTNAEWRDDWMTGNLGKRQAKRLKVAVERSEQLYGNLEERQVAVLRDFIAGSDFDAQISYAERLRRQQDLLQTLRQTSALSGEARPGVAQATAAVHAYLERAVHSPNPAYRAYLDKEIRDNCKAFAQLHNGTTPTQREHAVRRLAAYERDARELASQR
ncbi:MAG: hypothetical protein H7274_20515 [Rhodoferax sp.]|nr:hypothetical protein [Rhodoferax sp.]